MDKLLSALCVSAAALWCLETAVLLVNTLGVYRVENYVADGPPFRAWYRLGPWLAEVLYGYDEVHGVSGDVWVLLFSPDFMYLWFAFAIVASIIMLFYAYHVKREGEKEVAGIAA